MTSATSSDLNTPASFTFAGSTSGHQLPTKVNCTPCRRDASARVAKPLRGLEDQDTRNETKWPVFLRVVWVRKEDLRVNCVLDDT